MMGRVALAMALWAALSGAAHAADRRFALVIGWNRSDDPQLAPLRYADDDALRDHEVLAAISEKAFVFTEMDDETAGLLGERHVAAPTRARVLDALQELRGAMARAKQAGDRPILYFVYSGHGSVDAEGRGYVYLADGRFTARDLFGRVLAPTADDTVILMIDACNAALMVNGRGAPAERRPVGASRLDLADYPNVGVILASSSLGETHEWGRYLAGIFSHEVRSGLLGAADLDDDQQVTFAELAAFVSSANARVKNPTIRVTPYIRPPLTDPNIAIVDLVRGRFRAKLRIDRTITGKAHVLDADLVRYADFHRKAGSPAFWLALTRAGEATLVADDAEWVVPAKAAGDLALTALEKRARGKVSSRGAGSEYFDRTLFHEAYDLPYAEKYLTLDYLADLTLERFIQAPWYDNDTAWVALGAGLAATAAGIGMQVHAYGLASDAESAPWADQRRRLNGDIGTYQTGAAILYGVGGAAALTGVLLFVLDPHPARIESWRPPLGIELVGNGVRLRTGF